MNGTLIKMLVGFSAALCCTPPAGAPSVPPVVINEFMADNKPGSIVDGHGDADDWIELYNGGDGPVALGGYHLSDDSTDLADYALPDTLLPPGGFLLVWADNEPGEGPLHATFKLSAFDGDEIILSTGDSRIADRVQFFPRNNNPVARVPGRSYGRTADGGGVWDQQREATPGAPNSGGRGGE